MIEVKNLTKNYGDKRAVDNISFTANDGEILGFLGPNGAGKSTTMNILTGYISSTSGSALINGVDILEDPIKAKSNIGYLPELPPLYLDMTVKSYLNFIFDLKKCKLPRKSHLTDICELCKITDVKERIIKHLSKGYKQRVGLAQALIGNPPVLILDEPTNHLDFKTILWLEDYLKDYKGALLIVSHDRYFLDRIVTSVCEIETGILTRYKGNYTAFTRQKKENVARQMKEYEAQQKEIAKMEDFIAKNKVRASTANSAKSREKALERMELIEKPIFAANNAKIRFEYAVTPPFDILSVKDVDITVGNGADKKTLAEHISFEIKRGEKLGIIGDNGIGKSTFLKIIQGMLPHSGRIRWASNVRISYFEQESANLDPYNTVMDELHRHYPILTDLDIRSLLGRVGITGENVFKETGVISGGERAKVCFALMTLEKGNVLILDEPTNHLDLDAKEAIEHALDEFDGTVIFVSHDRYLLNKIAGKILEIKSGGAELFNGGFDYYLDISNKRRLAKQQLSDEEKSRKAAELAAEKNIKAYKSKEQRSIEAKKRNRIKELEESIENIQKELDALQAEITFEEVYSDFELMNSKCSMIDELKKKADEMFDEIVELSE